MPASPSWQTLVCSDASDDRSAVWMPWPLYDGRLLRLPSCRPSCVLAHLTAAKAAHPQLPPLTCQLQVSWPPVAVGCSQDCDLAALLLI